MKKIALKKTLKALFLSLLLLPFSAFASSLENVKQYTLENGMEVFLLEDKQDALVHIEYAVKAGFTSQTHDNAGFYKLYTRLIEKANPSLSFSSVSCLSDSSRYFLDIANAQLEETLNNLSEVMFAPQISDDLLTNELNKMKSEVKTSTEDMSVYINSAIDSKVFSDTPWKHDSGIYPSLFKHTTEKEARNYIKNISDKWYTPQNSALFISGNIKIEKLMPLINETFGRFFSSDITPISKPLKAINKHRKFVLHSPDLSPDLTQVVVQYTTLNMEMCDILSASLNSNSSTFKYNLLNIPSLNIPGDEYINVSSAHQKDNSRLIIQTLLQPPLDKKNKVPSSSQAESFCNEVSNIPSLLNEMEFLFGKGLILNDMNNITKDSVSLMNYLSSFWSILPYFSYEEIDYEKYPSSSLVAMMMNRVNKINNTSMSDTVNALKAENPFIFVIINSKDYKVNKKAYTDLGYEEITPNNASWYVQEMYKEIKKDLEKEKENEYISSSSTKDDLDNQYYTRNINKIKQSTLKNGINVVTKLNTDSSNISFLLSIKGGKLKSSDNNGFEEVMTNILSSLIEKEIYKKQQQGFILNAVTIDTKTRLNTSCVLIDFNKDDIIEVCDAIKMGIIYGEIPPAVADKEVSSRRYRKRLENGSAVNQMYAQAIKELYGENNYYNVFEAEKEILIDTPYLSILASYPELLDSSRYSIIVTGNFSDNLIPLLEGSIGLLNAQEEFKNKEKEEFTLPEKESKTVKITHTFLTDIPKEEAGPQPAILIPTTEFLDPVMYILKAPSYGTKASALFKGVLLYIEKEIQKELDNNKRCNGCTVTTKLPEHSTNFGTVIFNDVRHTKEIDSVYKTVINSLNKKLSNPYEASFVIQDIKNYWTTNKMKDARTNEGTAYLIQEGFEQFPSTPIPYIYLLEYNYIQKGSEKDYLDILSYFPPISEFRLYSKDSKK